MGLSEQERVQLLEKAMVSPAHWAMFTTKDHPRPWTPYKWHRLLNRKLVDLARARIEYRRDSYTSKPRFLIVSAPVRHGKSDLGTVNYSSWWLGTFPSDKVIIAAATKDLAEVFSRQSKDKMKEFGSEVFDVRVSKTSSAAARWDLESPHHGGVFAIGVGGAVVGRGGDLIILDDPTRNSEDANSPTWQEKILTWYRQDLRTRLMDGGCMVLIQSRWSERDLSGQLQKLQADAEEMGQVTETHWDHLLLPALAEPTDELPDPLGRAWGEPLCPEMWPEKALVAARDDPSGVGKLAFDSLYQSRPHSLEGDIFRSADWRYVDAAPAELTNLVRAWDFAGTEESVTSNDPDWTAGVLMGRGMDGRTYILDARRTREESADRDRFVRGTAIEDATYHRVQNIFIPQDPGQAGKGQVNVAARQLLPEFNVMSEPVTGDKVTRAFPLASQQRSNNVILVKGAWNATLVDEYKNFPRASHDDLVDAGASAYTQVIGATGPRKVRILA